MIQKSKVKSKSTTELLKKQGFGRVRVRIEIQFSWFGMNFKQARHLQKPSILAESKQFCENLHNYMKYLCQIMVQSDILFPLDKENHHSKIAFSIYMG